MQSKIQLTGLSVERSQFHELIEKRPNLAWIEVTNEALQQGAGQTDQQLEALQAIYPISLHHQGLSIGSTDPLNWQHLMELKDIKTRMNACLISDHIAWTSLNGQYFHSLLPLHYNDETRQHISSRIQQIQDYLKQPILIENIPHYVPFSYSCYSESAFLSDLAKETGCGILLDINALYVSSCNLNFNSKTYINELKSEHIQEIHVSGFTTEEINSQQFLIASKNRAILPAIWNLYRYCIEAHGNKATIVEWQSNLPNLATLSLEAFRAESIMREVYATSKLTG